MRIGIGLDMNGSIDEVVERARVLAATGASSLWASQIFGWDTLTALSIVAREVPEVELGTAVIPIHPRHPAILAAQALTVQNASAGRLVLGIGLSHQVVVEGVWGLSYARPAMYMEEYLSILVPLLHGEAVGFQGQLLRTNTFGPLEASADPPPVLIAALGPKMLEIAGRMTDGTVTWMVGLNTLADHIVPTIKASAAAAGRPDPQVVVTLPMCVTTDPDKARERAAKIFSVYGHLPSYKAMLDREGASGPPDVAIVGTEEEVSESIARFGEAGAAVFSGAVYGDPDEVARARALLGQLSKS